MITTIAQLIKRFIDFGIPESIAAEAAASRFFAAAKLIRPHVMSLDMRMALLKKVQAECGGILDFGSLA